jgi:peptide subunit release factor 1 (eRF1)
VHGPVVTLYLDVDGQRYIRPRDYEAHLDQLLRRARDHAEVEEDLRRIEGRVRAGLQRSRTKGVALFSCAADNFFEVFELPVRVRDQQAVERTPRVRQLEVILERYRPYGVLVTDRQRARMLVFQAGELRDRSELFRELPRHDDDRGDWDRDHVRDHTAALAQQHVRRAAQVAFALHQQRPFDHLILAGPETAMHEVERELHSYLRDGIVARLRLPVTASEDEIRAAAAQIEAGVERARTDGLVNRLRDAIGASGPGLLGLTPTMAAAAAQAAPIGAGAGSGVAGLESVLQSLFGHRVDTLLVSEDFEVQGWRCRQCEYLAARGPNCPLCRTTMDRVDDVVEEAIEVALAGSCRVVVCGGNADLDVLGRIGALLRF